MLVLAVAVSHSPAMEMTSTPLESWLKKRGWPATFDSLIIKDCLFYTFKTRLNIPSGEYIVYRCRELSPASNHPSLKESALGIYIASYPPFFSFGFAFFFTCADVVRWTEKRTSEKKGGMWGDFRWMSGTGSVERPIIHGKMSVAMRVAAQYRRTFEPSPSPFIWAGHKRERERGWYICLNHSYCTSTE